MNAIRKLMRLIIGGSVLLIFLFVFFGSNSASNLIGKIIGIDS